MSNDFLPKEGIEGAHGKKKYRIVSNITPAPKILNVFPRGPAKYVNVEECRCPPLMYPRLFPFILFSALSYESLCDGERDNRFKKSGNSEPSVRLWLFTDIPLGRRLRVFAEYISEGCVWPLSNECRVVLSRMTRGGQGQERERKFTVHRSQSK
jgi:hypothetical protein